MSRGECLITSETTGDNRSDRSVYTVGIEEQRWCETGNDGESAEAFINFEKNVKPHRWTRIAYYLVIGAILALAIFTLCSCATEAMRESWEQGYVSAEANDTEGVKAVMSAAMDKWGRPIRRCTPETIPRTVTAIEEDWTIGDFGAGLPLDWMFGTGGIGVIVLAVLRMMQERGKRKEMEGASADCVRAIEGIQDPAIKAAVKGTVAKAQAKNTALDKVVTKVQNGS